MPNLKKAFSFFCMKPEERRAAAPIVLLLAVLHMLVICRYYSVFSPLQGDGREVFIRYFQLSGFDPISYSVISHWSADYNPYRHPLLAFLMLVPYAVNQALTALTGVNCALFVMAALQLFAGTYSFVFIHRIFREVLALCRFDALLLSYFFFSFAYVLLTVIVPDHFALSLLLLLIALYAAGRYMKQKQTFGVWQSFFYFLLTAGVSLNNGLKIYLAALFTNGRRFFRPAYLLTAVVLPAFLLWGVSKAEYTHLVWPREIKVHAEKAKQKAKKTATTLQKPKAEKRVWRGKPIGNGQFMRWTDITTSRTETIVENLFGESIQLHRAYLLQDVMRSRPIVVHYSHAFNYVVELTICLLFAIGIWYGRRRRFLWLVLCCFLLDMALHLGLGFGINEVYIMSAHWIYVIPIAAGYLLLQLKAARLTAARSIVALLTAYLSIYNVMLISSYLLS